jgi:Mg2+-importing ATPase
MSLNYWAQDEEALVSSLESTRNGLTSAEAEMRLEETGPNILKMKKEQTLLSALVTQFKSPIIIILLFSALLAFAASDNFDGLIIITIVISSSLLGFWQEHMANNAVSDLLAMVEVKTSILRDGAEVSLSIEDVVPGDVILLSAGDVVPADARILQSDNLFIDEAPLTGETFPAEKQTGVLPEDARLAKRTNCAFMGTYVSSGTCRAIVVMTGKKTEFGKITQQLAIKPPTTEFELGIKRFGYMLMELTMLFIISIFALNVYFQRPVLDSFLFALALAVGITPQLLPTIVTVTLSAGAKQMAKKKVIVKKLNAIEDFGSMNVLCTDKTGTITMGTMEVHSGTDFEGRQSDQVLNHAFLNASFQTGYKNPIDKAIVEKFNYDLSAYSKVDELPYDFVRKRLSVLLRQNGGYLLITKGAVNGILDCCSKVLKGTDVQDISSYRKEIFACYEKYSTEGFRTIALAYKEMKEPEQVTRETEKDLVFTGFLLLSDPVKERICETLAELRSLGVAVKVVTGDNRIVAAHIGRQIEMSDPSVMTGTDLRQTSDEALTIKVGAVDIFAEVEPNQKERIIRALKRAGNVVGYMGDGINDAPALHSADVGISVDTAVDVAKEAAQFILLEKDLEVLTQGVRAGRATFANTIKYIITTMSANFGNMFSMAGASLIIPFLPLLPKQILGINFMTDLPGMTIASDNVDTEMVSTPHRWDMKFISRFMVTFGLLSTLFDFISFAVLLTVGSAQPDVFRTGWFIVSVITELLVMLIIRTQRPFYRSRPGRSLLWSSLLVFGIVLILPFTPIGEVMSLIQLSPFVLSILVGIVMVYLILNELMKRVFYRYVHW